MRTEKRAAFDIGSGSTKIQCSIVQFENGDSFATIIETLMQKEVPVSFGADFMRSNDGILSRDIMNEGLAVLRSQMAEAQANGFAVFCAIATEVFRRAKNGSEYLDQVRHLGIKVELVNQILEADLGFNSVVATGNLDPSSAMVWDSGGASFQITSVDLSTGSLRIYMGSLGTSISTAILVRDVQSRNLSEVESVNPVSSEDCSRFVDALVYRLDEAPCWLLGSQKITAATGKNSLFKLCCDVLSVSATSPVTSFSLPDARNALESCLGKTDGELRHLVSFSGADGPEVIVPKLALLVAVLLKTNIQQVDTVPVVGSCPGMLRSNIAGFWE